MTWHHTGTGAGMVIGQARAISQREQAARATAAAGWFSSGKSGMSINHNPHLEKANDA
ncbi:MAG: hypothetical protein KA002_01805 [Firmicutes bacterium]|nr:hypothetical protein [Bacillota bacterium]